MVIMIVPLGKTFNLMVHGLLLLLLLFGSKVMVLVVLKKTSVQFPHMMNALLWFMNKDLLLMVLLLLLVDPVLVMLNLNKMDIMIVPLGKTSCLMVLGLLLLLHLVGFKVMVLVVLKKNSVKLLHMMNVLLWFITKDLLPMVLLLLLVVLVLVMLNLNKMVIMIVPLGKTSCLMVLGLLLLLYLLLLFGFKVMVLVVLKNNSVKLLHTKNVLLWFMTKDLLPMVLLLLLVVLVLVMLNLNKMVIMIVLLGKTSCLMVHGLLLLLHLVGYKVTVLVVMKKTSVR
jgi:hypothetical protein